jgi:citrate synthase
VGQGEPTPEALVWLLLTDTIPTKEQAESLSHELYKRGGLPKEVTALIKGLPKDLHPMSQLVIGLMALQVRAVAWRLGHACSAMKSAPMWLVHDRRRRPG